MTDLSTCGFWYPWRVLKAIPCGYEGFSVSSLNHHPQMLPQPQLRISKTDFSSKVWFFSECHSTQIAESLLYSRDSEGYTNVINKSPVSIQTGWATHSIRMLDHVGCSQGLATSAEISLSIINCRTIARFLSTRSQKILLSLQALFLCPASEMRPSWSPTTLFMASSALQLSRARQTQVLC